MAITKKKKFLAKAKKENLLKDSDVWKNEDFSKFARAQSTQLLPELLPAYAKKEKPYKLSDGLTQSMLKTYMSCPHAFLFSINRWEQIGKVWKTNFGNFFHEILAYFIENPADALKEDWEKTANEVIDSYLSKEDLRELPDEIETDRGLVIALIGGYLNQYKEDFAKFKPYEVEKTFDAEYRGFRLRGKIDAVIKNQNGELWKQEHKTSGRISEDIKIASLAFDFQNLFYTFVKKRVLGEDIKGTIYNVNRKPQLRKRKTENLPDFIKRVREDIDSRPEWYYYRYEIQYTERDLDRFQQDLDSLLNEIKDVVGGKIIPIRRNYMSCDRGMYPCDFLEMCSSGLKDKFYQKEILFTELAE